MCHLQGSRAAAGSVACPVSACHSVGQAGGKISGVAEASLGLGCMGVAFAGVITDSPVDLCSLTLRFSNTSTGVETIVAQVPLKPRESTFSEVEK